MPFGGVAGLRAAVLSRCAAATVLELSEPLDVVAAPLAAPVLCDGHEFTVHGFREAEVIAASGVLGGLAGPWFAVREFQGPSGAGFAGTPVFDRDVDAVVGLLGETGVYPLANLLEPWPWLRDLLGWRLDHDPALRTHWLPRARGSEVEADTGSWYFTGRTEARRELCAWLEAGPPLLVVTGGPGTGKSAVLAHVLVGADARWAPRVPTGGPRPAPGTVDIALHLKGFAFDDVVEWLAALSDVTAADPGELLVALRDRRETAGRAVTVLCDALDEAVTAEESVRIARLLAELAVAGVARVVVGVRTAPPGSLRARVHRVWGRSTPVLDLESERFLRREDIAEYVASRLAGDDTEGRYRDGAALRDIAETVATRARHNFLVAQLTSRWLLLPGTPVASADLDEALPTTVGEAMEKYLDAFGPDRGLVERVLTALAFARGSGLPRNDLWVRLAEALTPGYDASAADLARVFDSAASYLIETETRVDGSPTYRLYHEVLDEHLRENCAVAAPHRAVVETLVRTVPEQGSRRNWEAADSYVRTQLAGHAARAGVLDDLLTDGGFLVHADPSPLLAVLHKAVTTNGRLAVACYRASSADHRSLAPSARAQVLALDAARLGAHDLREQFARESIWPVTFSTGARQHGALLATLRAEQGNVSSIAAGTFEGRAIAVSGSEGGRVRLWDVADQRPIGSVISGLPWSSYQSPALALTTLDGRLMAVVGGRNQVQVWDVLAASMVAEWTTGKSDSITAVAVVEHDGRVLVLATSWEGMNAWDLRTHRLVAGPVGKRLQALAFAELHGVPVVVTGGWTEIRTWTLDGLRETGQAMTSAESVFQLAVTEVAGRPVAITGTGDGSGAVELWDLSFRSQIGETRTDHGWSVSGIAVTEIAGRPVAVTSSGHNSPGPDDEDTTLLVWDLLEWRRVGKPLAGHTQGTQAVAVVEVDGRPTAVTGGGWDGTVRLWDLTLAEQQVGDPTPGHGMHILEMAVLDRGPHRLAVSAALDDTAFVWDLRGHRVVGRAPVNFCNFVGLEESFGEVVAVLAGIGFAEVHNLGTGSLITLQPASRPLRASRQYASGPAHVSAGAMARWGGRPVVALGSSHRAVQLHDPVSGRTVGRAIDVSAPAATPADKVDATANVPARIALLLVAGRPAAVVLSSRRASDDGFTGAVWDLLDGTLIATLEPPASQAATTCVVGGLTTVITVGAQGVIRVWDAGAQRTLRTIESGGDHIQYLASGLRRGRPVVLAAGYRGPLGVWDLATGAAVDEIRLPDACRGIALGEDGALVVAIQNDVAVFETEIRGVVPDLGPRS
ncbi:hypothetical protein [Actinophytocola gossypii]|uniref:WD40 repeat domain-containing protein n=1 Tax=Actinophytocola gossypii TaxID=2812003 RepID=A0ABT2JI43_9PSEU|nr:hypothetical protein [Actinophytocola gossypii]MCT2587557.1 hypothetical protein [Actinophytocola gossypii]